MTLRPLLRADAYTRADVWEAERALVFGRGWLVLGALAALPDGHATALNVAGHPLILRRQGPTVRGFLNVCAHRAGPLLWEGDTEPCPRFRCRYHGWQYDLDGRLVRAPHFDDDPQAPLPQARLTPVHTAVWRGLIFGCLDPDPPLVQPLFDELAQAFGPLDWTGFQVHRSASHPLACNWKTYAENYLEGYHIPFLHPSLAREVDLRAYQVHPGRELVLHQVPPGPDGVYQGVWAWVWPNTAINVYQGGLSLERVIPLGPDRMRIDYTYLFGAEVPEAARERSVAMSAEVTDEDRKICEAIHRNLASGHVTPGPLSPRHERGVHAFQARVVEALGPALDPGPPAR